MTITSDLAATLCWDRDSGYGAPITELRQRASASPSVDMDLEMASSITSEIHSGSTTKLETSSRSGTHQLKGLQGQQKAPSKPDDVHLGTGLPRSQLNEGLKNQQKPPKQQDRHRIPTEEAMMCKILLIYVNRETAHMLAYNSISLFPKSEREFLRLLWRRTKVTTVPEIRDIIYSPLFLEIMHERPDAIIFQVRLISPVLYLF